MQMPHGTLIAVADGAHLELYRNAGQEAQAKLSAVPAPHLAPHGSDSGKRHRASSANPDHHLLEEDDFIAAIADWLNHQAIEGAIERLVIVAPPRALGELRHHYHPKLSEKILAEIDHDLVGRPVAEIESALIHAKAL